MGTELWVALALVCVIEGFFPFVSPKGYRESVEKLSKLPDKSLRVLGLLMMVLGAVLLHFFH